jgi:hypothetical protein
MPQLRIEKLQENINGIIKDYESFRQGLLENNRAVSAVTRFRSAVGFRISALKKYELENGYYEDRVVCVAPNCAYIVDLCLLYNTENGPARYILSLHPGDKPSTIAIYKNKLYYLTPDKYTCPRDARISFSKKYNAVNPSKQEKHTREKKSPLKNSIDNFPQEFLCPTRNKHCCYLSMNHSNDCKSCCLDIDHYLAS